MDTNVDHKISSFLSFKLGDETFAANVSKVLNILELTKITKVPQSPAYMLGVINVRGTVLPVVDLRTKFGMPPAEFTTSTCILVLEILMEDEPVQVGALVDSVQEVLELNEKDVEAAPSIGNKYKSDFIAGVAKQNEDFILLLHMDLILAVDDYHAVKESLE